MKHFDQKKTHGNDGKIQIDDRFEYFKDLHMSKNSLEVQG